MADDGSLKSWEEIFKSGVLDDLVGKFNTVAELAAGMSEVVDRPVTQDSLTNAHRRHRWVLKLKPLKEYLAPTTTKTQRRRMRPEDYRFEFSEERWAELEKAKRFVVTCAMNNAPVEPNVWASLQRYCNANDAMLIVIPSRYRNPTSPQETSKTDQDVWWAKEVLPYLTDECIELHEHLMLMAHVRVQATAVNPLTGLETLSGGSSAVFGHAQLAMQMVPTPQNRMPKVLYTTGSVTEPRYSRSRAGVKGEHHHGFGAVIVELDGEQFHIRGLVADDNGGFYDLERYYHPRGIRRTGRVSALVTGDEHALWRSQECLQATYKCSSSIVNTLRPRTIVRHDVFDGYSISHHNRKDVVAQVAKHRSGMMKLETELQYTHGHIEGTTPKDTENLIVASNHNEHLLRWMKEVTPADEPWNADVWLNLWTLLKDTIQVGSGGVEHSNPLELWLKDRLKAPTRFTNRDSNEAIEGILVGYHGDQGFNGSRGSLQQYGRMGAKTVIGHSHTPGIRHGCYQVGTSSELRLDYNRGPSSWAHAHCVIYPNGKRQMIFIVNGRWRAT